ncbi:hypothetical protein QTP81_00840 [Alteromonas sp. ASW11-36]|uniref:MSHA biogenesis protein MshJ n=1 Tax=Alteromonas arenosi TaxID=3055817 RepID=A0ABT7SSH0_9ALTE|nr:hypothetical protein [Alteromonas sp. ASW11-36]MDM7859148.1 hypothetical protein [Alteromonas sp. ASW11-36]
MFDKWNEQFLALSKRERNLIVLTGVILILFAGFTFIVEPQMKDNNRVTADLDTKELELLQAEQNLTLLQEAIADDPNRKLEQRIADLNQRIDSLDLEFATQMRELVPAKQMPLVIEQMLAAADNLTLVEFASIAPVSVFADDAENADLPLYQHGVKFVFEGGYANVLHYLETVEAYPYQIYWRSLDYQVSEYPNATITLELFTLSTSRAFMGVQ